MMPYGLMIKLGLALLIVSAATGAWFYVQSLRAENAMLVQREQVLKDVVQSKEVQIATMKANIEIQTKALVDLSKDKAASNERNAELVRLLGANRIGRIAAKKPLIIQKKMNAANKKWLKEMREITKPNVE